MTHRVTDVYAVFDAGGKLFCASQVGPQHFLGSIKHRLPEVFDRLVFGWPAALRVGIPALLPVKLLAFVRFGDQFDFRHHRRRSRQATVNVI